MLLVHATNRRPEQSGPYFSTANLAVPRKRFLQIGGFDERFAFAHEDREFCARWIAHGWDARPVHSALVQHSHHFTLASFCQQHFRYGKGAVDYYRIQGDTGPAVPLARRVRFYSALLRHPWDRLKATRAWRISALLALSQGCYAAGYYWTLSAARRRRQ